MRYGTLAGVLPEKTLGGSEEVGEKKTDSSGDDHGLFYAGCEGCFPGRRSGMAREWCLLWVLSALTVPELFHRWLPLADTPAPGISIGDGLGKTGSHVEVHPLALFSRVLCTEG